MPRGNPAKVGDTNISDNGYHYTRTAEGWRLTHHIIAEAKYNRKIDKDVTVRFVDGDRRNLNQDNIIIKPIVVKDTRKKILQRRIRELKAELDLLEMEPNNE